MIKIQDLDDNFFWQLSSASVFVKPWWQVEVHQGDPYRELRQICVYILMRNSGRLLAAAKAQKLAAELETQQASSEKGWMDPEFERCEITLNDPKIIQGC